MNADNISPAEPLTLTVDGATIRAARVLLGLP